MYTAPLLPKGGEDEARRQTRLADRMVATGRRNVRKRRVPKKLDESVYEPEAPSDVEQLLVFDTEIRTTPDQRLIFLVWRLVIDIAYASDLDAAETALFRRCAAEHVSAAAPVCGRLASRLRFVSSPCGASLALRSVASQIEAHSVDPDPVVDMEAAALLAVGEFRHVPVGVYLSAGDDIAGSKPNESRRRKDVEIHANLAPNGLGCDRARRGPPLQRMNDDRSCHSRTARSCKGAKPRRDARGPAAGPQAVTF